MTFDEIVDLALDENFNVYIDHTGDLAGVKGRTAFEQELVIRLTERMRGLIGRGDADEQTLVELARSYTRRIANEMDELDEIASFSAELSGDAYSTLEIELVYDTGGVLTFDIES
jgi:hypothetical protein